MPAVVGAEELALLGLRGRPAILGRKRLEALRMVAGEVETRRICGRTIDWLLSRDLATASGDPRVLRLTRAGRVLLRLHQGQGSGCVIRIGFAGEDELRAAGLLEVSP